ncbi:MAG: signal peptidase I [Candidatus Nanoarchaeia archaeon]
MGNLDDFYNFPDKEVEKAGKDINRFKMPVLPSPLKEVSRAGKSGGKAIGRASKQFWKFLRKDSLPSLIVSLILAFIIIKYVFFPILSFFTGTALPLVIVESCSMYHAEDFEEIIDEEIYEDFDITQEQADKWDFKNGLNKGDVIFVVGADKHNLDVGDVVIFARNTGNPVIHRVIELNGNSFTTKGDNNPGLLQEEKQVSYDRLVGKAVFRIPWVGWIKLIFFEPTRPASQRGLC